MPINVTYSLHFTFYFLLVPVERVSGCGRQGWFCGEWAGAGVGRGGGGGTVAFLTEYRFQSSRNEKIS